MRHLALSKTFPEDSIELAIYCRVSDLVWMKDWTTPRTAFLLVRVLKHDLERRDAALEAAREIHS